MKEEREVNLVGLVCSISRTFLLVPTWVDGGLVGVLVLCTAWFFREKLPLNEETETEGELFTAEPVVFTWDKEGHAPHSNPEALLFTTSGGKSGIPQVQIELLRE